MIPLYDRHIYDRLSDIRGHLGASGISGLAQVFVPVGPAPSADSLPRIHFVGQATKDWHEMPADYDGCWAASAQIVLHRLTEPGNSRFWNAVIRVLTQVLLCAGIPAIPENFLKVTGYSNLLKIGFVNRNPAKNDPIAMSQLEACSEALRSEIATIRPTATVLMSGGEFNSGIINKAFGEGWRQTALKADRVGVKVHPDMGHILWTDHPRTLQSQGGQVEAEVLGFVAGYISALAGDTPFARQVV
jgi:hypothetical protein